MRPSTTTDFVRSRRRPAEQKGIHDVRPLPDAAFDGLWDLIIVPPGIKDRLLSQSVVNFTARGGVAAGLPLPMHGIILLVGPPGTGKTSLARGLASRAAASLSGQITFVEVDPHALASAAHGKTQQAVTHLLGTVLAEELLAGPCIVLLDEGGNPCGRPPQDEHGDKPGGRAPRHRCRAHRT